MTNETKKERDSKGLFQKGNSIGRNGGGRPKSSEEQKTLQRLTRTELRNILNKYILSPKKEVMAFKKDKNISMLEQIVISSLLHAIKEGDVSRLNWFLEQLIGKAPNVEEKQRINITFKKISEISDSENN